MKLTIIVPAFNEEAYLVRTLDSVQTAAEELRARSGIDVDTIVVDNKSEDQTAAVARSKGARVVHEPVRSRRFVALSAKRLRSFLSRPLGELGLRVVCIDGKVFREHCIVVALGIDTQGCKHVLGLREGATETTAVASGLLSDLVTRGLPTDRTLLFVIDGAPGLRRAITDVCGSRAVVQRCQVHYADVRIMPMSAQAPLPGKDVCAETIGIITGLRETPGACPGDDSGRGGRQPGWFSPARVPSTRGRHGCRCWSCWRVRVRATAR